MKNKKNNLIILITSILFGTSFVYIQKGQAIASTVCDKYSGNTEASCEALENKAKTTQDILSIKIKQENILQKQMQLIDAEQVKNQSEFKKTQEEVYDYEEKIESIQREITYKESLISYQKILLSKLLQSYYEYYQDGVLKIILANNDFSKTFNQTDRVKQIGTSVADLLRDIQKNKEDLKAEQVDVQERKIQSEKLKEKLENKNLALQESENKKQELLGQTQAEKIKYQELLYNIESEINRLEEALSASVNTANLPPDKNGYFTWPVNPHILTQGYGKTSFAKSSGIYKNDFHNGFDFSVNYKNLFAAKNGKMIASGDNGKYAYGKWIAIDHGDGLTTLYGHLSEKNVNKGDNVKEGQKIGTTGNTGKSTGPHLHFSVFVTSSFRMTESSFVGGLMIPTGASVSPQKYL